MGFTIIDVINLAALFISIIGTYIMFYFSPTVSSIHYIYRKEEMNKIRKRDTYKNTMIRRGMLLLFVGFIFQAIAIFLSIVLKN